jgi:hypothetical protein
VRLQWVYVQLKNGIKPSSCKGVSNYYKQRLMEKNGRNGRKKMQFLRKYLEDKIVTTTLTHYLQADCFICRRSAVKMSVHEFTKRKWYYHMNATISQNSNFPLVENSLHHEE